MESFEKKHKYLSLSYFEEKKEIIKKFIRNEGVDLYIYVEQLQGWTVYKDKLPKNIIVTGICKLTDAYREWPFFIKNKGASGFRRNVIRNNTAKINFT